MVCIYCGNETGVINSRHQKKVNQVWRRRQCRNCAAIFTTLEGVDLSNALRIQKDTAYEPFSREKLLLSVYDSLRHRPTAVEDASALTATILSKLDPYIQDAAIDRDALVTLSITVLERFDKPAATHYRAFHP